METDLTLFCSDVPEAPPCCGSCHSDDEAYETGLCSLWPPRIHSRPRHIHHDERIAGEFCCTVAEAVTDWCRSDWAKAAWAKRKFLR
jgi:hypothetical protein